MGDLCTGRFWIIFGPLVSVGIIGINLYFTYTIIASFDSVIAYVIVGIIAVLYVVYLVRNILYYFLAVSNGEDFSSISHPCPFFSTFDWKKVLKDGHRNFTK